MFCCTVHNLDFCLHPGLMFTLFYVFISTETSCQLSFVHNLAIKIYVRKLFFHKIQVSCILHYFRNSEGCSIKRWYSRYQILFNDPLLVENGGGGVISKRILLVYYACQTWHLKLHVAPLVLLISNFTWACLQIYLFMMCLRAKGQQVEFKVLLM